jgi:hypothetical protein
LSALALPPLSPPRRPRATAAGFFSGMGSFVLISTTFCALAMPLLCLSGLAYAMLSCVIMAGMTHWHIIQLMKDAVLMAAIVAAIVIIYRKLKGVG